MHSRLEGGHHTSRTSRVSTQGSKAVDTGSWDSGKAGGWAGVPAAVNFYGPESPVPALSHQSLPHRWPRGTGSYHVPLGSESGQSRRREVNLGRLASELGQCRCLGAGGGGQVSQGLLLLSSSAGLLHCQGTILGSLGVQLSSRSCGVGSVGLPPTPAQPWI